MSDVWDLVSEEARRFPEDVKDLPVVRPVDAAPVRRRLAERYGAFERPVPASELFDDVARMMREWTAHGTHPRYFGLFNPDVLPAAAAADALAAVWNPQLAIWSHAPAAAEIERHALGFLGSRLGFDPATSVASFTSGGQEANLSAVLAALARACPAWVEEGVAAIGKPQGIYLSAESHDSIIKVARVAGLGRHALRFIPVDDHFRMTPAALCVRIERDRERGRQPLMVVGTAGTTGAGAIDPLPELADVAEAFGLWFHVDAAWGGSAALSPRLAPALAGVERADSVTWDAHKGMSVPMGAGMFFCRHPDATARAFSARPSYATGSVRDTVDPYLGSLQWSRRFIGLKVFAALAERGAKGYAELIDHQAQMAESLRERLVAASWRIVNATPLPLVCFTHPRLEAGQVTAHAVEKAVRASGEAWISSVRLGDPPLEALRACITGYRTKAADLEALTAVLTRVVEA
jgi:glutamate/tyrosine decarboxylase-like PLP-dependent enzyme